LDFEKCTGGPSTASVLLNVVAAPDATAATTMMPFWRQVCSVQTTTPAQSLQQLRLYFTETPTGNSSCVGTVLSTEKAASIDKRTCKELCISDVQKYSSSLDTLQNSPAMCTGYSFDTTGAEGCTLYKGAITPSDAGVTGTYCWTLEAQAAELHQSTPAPPSQAEILEMQATLPKLNVTMSAHSANVLTFVSTDKCFQPFNWITMQNYAAMALSTAFVNVKQSEWEEFLALIPSARRLSSSEEDMSATILADRALYGIPPTVKATPAPGVVVPDCAAPPAVPASMTMTWVLTTVLILCAGGGYYANHGSPAGAAAMMANMQGGGKNVAPQDPGQQQALMPASAPPPAESGLNPAGPGMGGGPGGPGGPSGPSMGARPM